MTGGTKQKDSFLSMFARGNNPPNVSTRKVASRQETKQNVGINVARPSRPQAQTRKNPQFSTQPYQNQQQAASQNKQPQEPEEEGQLNIDVYQTEEDIVIKSAISGVKAEDLDINIQNDMVTIRGRRRPTEQVDPEDYYYQECFWGTFSRAVILPVDIDPENVRAELEDGILTIRLPKAEKIKTRKIQVVEK
jgi:HSP20 family protein